MASEEQLKILLQGVPAWNEWRAMKPGRVDLFGADLSEVALDGWVNLREADLTRANLQGAQLWHAILHGANLREAHLEGAYLQEASLERAHLEGAHLEGAHLEKAFLIWANLQEAHLEGAHLQQALLTWANLQEAHLEKRTWSGRTSVGLSSDRLRVRLWPKAAFSASVWDTAGLIRQTNEPIITDRFRHEPVITVDNIKVAQFIYLLLNNEKFVMLLTPWQEGRATAWSVHGG
jgi:hypothetical protein